MKAIIKYATEVEHTPRVMQMASLFDLPLEEKLATSIVADLPIEEHPWNVGLIVGPSGSGKSSIARRLWPDNIVTDQKATVVKGGS
jgi:ABC-type protease/lipase transport system fused ATPase/permease subunit